MPTPATGTINVLDATALVAGVTTLTVGGKTYTFVATSPTSSQIEIGATDPLTAANIAIRVTTDTLTTLCTASAYLDVVTLTANTEGTAGNLITLSETALPTALTVTAFAGGYATTLVTRDDVKERLNQLEGSSAHDDLIDTICAEVEDAITLYLGFSFDGYTDETTLVAIGNGTPWLVLPPHEQGSITTVTVTGDTTDTAITGWTEQPDGTLYLDNYYPTGRYGWNVNRFTVTGNFGYGEWPAALKRVAIEMAVNAFRERDKGHFSDVVGVEGAGGDVAVGYKGAWLKSHKAIMDLTKRKYMGVLIA